MIFPDQPMTLEKTIDWLHSEYNATGDSNAENLYVWLLALESYKKGYREMVELHTPKEPVCWGEFSTPSCPNCGMNEFMRNDDGIKNEHCGHCGQFLMWNEDDFFIDSEKY